MRAIETREQTILAMFLKNETMASSDVHKELLRESTDISLVTTKRTLGDMARSGLLNREGFGRSAAYRISVLGRINAKIDVKKYCAIEPDKRYGMSRFNFSLFAEFPEDIFFENEMQILNDATAEYNRRTSGLPESIQKREMERLVIELSWKSSRIEGNTYTLLDTEKLILENKEAPGHSRDEAQMILNHKDAFTFVHQHRESFQTLTRVNAEKLHAILVQNLNVNLGLRKKPVGVLGSKYAPLDNVHQITDATNDLFEAIARTKNPYSAALLALCGIGYIQPFEDGNKRTGRLSANALLVARGLAPLSYRSVDENEYREAMLAFYELNSLVALKNIFISQYDFAARNYAVR